MKILQSDKGDGLIAFTKMEVETINKKGCIRFEANSLAKFATHLVKIASEILQKVPEEDGNKNCQDGEEIETLK